MADNFLTVGITTPFPFMSPQNEAKHISNYLESRAIDLFHIRKPASGYEYTRILIRSIDQNLYPRLVLHSHYSLNNEFNLGGIHIKQTCPVNTVKYSFKTRSCHSLKECNVNPELYGYSFLSPIFDSISKEGYLSGFTLDDPVLLHNTSKLTIVALGGVMPHLFQKLFNAKFAGAALLGYLWSPKNSINERIDSLLKARNEIN